MRRLITLLAFLAWPACVAAQLAPGAFTTLTTTSTSADSLHVGCAVGSSTCTGGIKAGPIVATTGTFSGDVSSSSSNSGATNSISIANTSNTASSRARFLATVGGTSSSDPLITFSVSGATDWSAGIDNSDSDSFVIAASNALGTSNVLALTTAGVATLSGIGAHTITGGTNNVQSLGLVNTTSGTAAFTRVAGTAGSTGSALDTFSQGYTTSNSAIASSTRLLSDGSGGLTLIASNGSGIIRFETGGENLRWGVNAAGDFTFGTSSNLAMSNGTPTSSCGGSSTIAGTDYALKQTKGSNNVSNCTVTFGHTWSNIPVCTVSSATGNIAVTHLQITTGGIIVNFAATASVDVFQIVCLGY